MPKLSTYMEMYRENDGEDWKKILSFVDVVKNLAQTLGQGVKTLCWCFREKGEVERSEKFRMG